MYIQNNNLIIRNVTADDAPILSQWWNDGKVMEHAGFPNGLCTSEDEILSQISHNTDDNHRLLLIEIDGVPAGEMNYRNQGNGIAEIGIKICDFSKQEKGYGKKLLSMLINVLFNQYGYEKIVLDTNLNNLRAQQVYEKLGFQKVRINVDSWKNQLGELQSSFDLKLEKKDFVDYTL